MTHYRHPSHRQRNEQGQAVVLMAFAMIGLLAFLALAIDGGNTYTERRRAQNAADGGVLAGVRTLWIQRTQGNNTFETTLLQAINTSAEANGIDDTDNVAGNHINTNVQAFYTDRDGVDLPGNNVVGTLGAIPSSAEGLRVVALRSFTGFFSSIIGRPNLAADAGATAVYIPPKGCGDFAVYAGCTDCSPNTLKVTGSGPIITGAGLHSNGDIHIQNMTIVDGYIEYGSTCGTGDCNSIAPASQVGPNAMQQLWDIADFQPGGSEANKAGATGQYFQFGSLDESDIVANGDGLYYVTGDVALHAPVGNVTIVALGTIKVTGSANIRTFRQEWPLLFSDSSNSANGAIQISGSNAQWTGFIYAPSGKVKISAASNSTMQGAIYSNQVDLSGAQISINYDPAYCPPTRARVILLK